jgi:hypothetical protein
MPYVLGTLRVHRIPPRVRDDREPPPSVGRDGDGYSTDLQFWKTEYFFVKRWTFQKLMRS